jgi:hypothetical protein
MNDIEEMRLAVMYYKTFVIMLVDIYKQLMKMYTKSANKTCLNSPLCLTTIHA